MRRRLPGSRSYATVLVAWLLVTALHPHALADDASPETERSDDDAIGFGGSFGTEADAANADEPVAVAAHRPPPIAFALKHRNRVDLWAERLDDAGLASARQSLDASLRYKQPLAPGTTLRVHVGGHAELDAAYLARRAHFDDATFDAYESQFWPDETFAALDVDHFDVALGFQHANLGQGEVLSVLDRAQPHDLREPGLADLNDVRLAVLMARAGVGFGRHRIEVLAIPEVDYGLLAPPLSGWSPLRRLLLSDPSLRPALENRTLRYRDTPDTSLFSGKATQAFGRYDYAGPSFDLSFLVGASLDPLGIPELPPPEALAEPEVHLPVDHPRYHWVGHGGTWPVSDWLLRWELAYDRKRTVAMRDVDTTMLRLSPAQSNVVHGMLGVTYVGVTDASIALEASRAVLTDRDVAEGTTRVPLAPLEATRLALRVDYDLWSGTANLRALGAVIGLSSFNAALLRVEASYELLQGMRVRAGFVGYRPSKKRYGPFYGFTDHERIFIELEADALIP